MEEIKQKIVLLEEKYESWRILQHEKEKHRRQSYEQSLAKLNEDYAAAERKIDLEFSARRRLLLQKYGVKVDNESPCQKDRSSSSIETDPQNSADKDHKSITPVSHHRSASPPAASLSPLPCVSNRRLDDRRVVLLHTEKKEEQQCAVNPIPQGETVVVRLNLSIGFTIEPKNAEDQPSTSECNEEGTFAQMQRRVDVNEKFEKLAIVLGCTDNAKGERNRSNLSQVKRPMQLVRKFASCFTEMAVFDPGGSSVVQA